MWSFGIWTVLSCDLVRIKTSLIELEVARIFGLRRSCSTALRRANNTFQGENDMTKRVIAFFTIVVATISTNSQAQSQSRCYLTENNSPNVRGLRLGMSTQELLALFPGSASRWAKDPTKVREARETGMAASSIEPFYVAFEAGTDAPKDQFADVDSVEVGLYKGRVTEFTVVYVGVEWSNIDTWLAKVSETLKLPAPKEWVVGPNETPNKILRCSGIEIEVAIQGGGSSIRIRNMGYLKGVGERTTTNEKRRREFKP